MIARPALAGILEPGLAISRRHGLGAVAKDAGLPPHGFVRRRRAIALTQAKEETGVFTGKPLAQVLEVATRVLRQGRAEFIADTRLLLLVCGGGASQPRQGWPGDRLTIECGEKPVGLGSPLLLLDGSIPLRHG